MHLLAFDLHNLISRSFFVGDQRVVLRDGSLGHGINGALESMLKRIVTLKPTHVAVAADSSISHRKQHYPHYKANRPQKDPDLVRQCRDVARLLPLMGWPMTTIEGYEGDDILASLAKQFPGQVTIVSGDHDMLALCSDRVQISLLQQRGDDHVCGPAECRAKLGVWPHQVCEYKALAGDQSDGIVGIPGIGAKRAAALLTQYDTLANAYQHLADFSPTVQRRLEAGQESARTSWNLARMKADLPVEWQPSESLFSPAIAEVANAIGLITMAQRLRSVPFSISAIAAVDVEPSNTISPG